MRQRILSDMASFAYAERHLRRETRARMAREDEEARLEAAEAAAGAIAEAEALDRDLEAHRSRTTTMSGEAPLRPSAQAATGPSVASPVPPPHEDVTMEDRSGADTAATTSANSSSTMPGPRAATLATERRLREHLALMKPQLGKAETAERLLEGHLEQWARPVQDPQADPSIPENFWHALPTADLELWVHLSRQTHRGRVLKHVEGLRLAEKANIDKKSAQCDQSIDAMKAKGEQPLSITMALKDSLWHSWERVNICGGWGKSATLSNRRASLASCT